MVAMACRWSILSVSAPMASIKDVEVEDEEDIEVETGEATLKPKGFLEKLNRIPPLTAEEQLIIVP